MVNKTKRYIFFIFKKKKKKKIGNVLNQTIVTDRPQQTV